MLLLGLVLGAAGLATNAAGQTAQWRVVQGSDGTLYVVSDAGRYTLQVDPIADEDLASLPDLGTAGPFVGALSAPPTSSPSVEAVPETSPPGADQSLEPPDASASPLPVPQSSPEVVPPSGGAPASGDTLTPPTPTPASPPSGAAGGPTSVPLPLSPPSGAGSGAPGTGLPPPTPPSRQRGLAPLQSLGPISGGAPTPTPSALPNPIPNPSPSPSPTSAAAAEAPVLLSGTGSQTTRSFTLRGGTYTALWSSTTPTSTADTFAAILRPSDPANLHTQVIATALVPGSRTVSGQAQLISLPPGSYSVEIVGGTNWTLSIAFGLNP